jgi:hypothetical protein
MRAMKEIPFLGIAAGAALLLAGCSNLVKADRSKVPDDLYQPTPATGGSGGGGLGGAGGSESDAGSDDADGAGDAATPSDAGDAVEAAGSEAGNLLDAHLEDAADGG